MKKISILNVFILAVMAFSLVNCSDDDDGVIENGAQSGELVAVIDGESFSASGVNVGAQIFNGIFNVSATDPSTQQTITITVSGASEGTFDLGEGVNGSAGAYTIGGGNAFLSGFTDGSGTITITKLDTDNMLASGTFSFVGTRQETVNGEIESVTITEGAFTDITLLDEVVGSSDSVMFAKIDGTDFNPEAVTALEITFQGQTTISISGLSNSTNQNIGITFPADLTVGTYDFDSLPLPGSVIAQYNPNLGGSQTTVFVSIDGSLTITEIDDTAGTIAGSFFFTAGDFIGQDDTTYEITEGTFTVSIL